jgi:hypothetical protein
MVLRNQSEDFTNTFIRNLFKHAYKVDYAMVAKSLMRRMDYAKNVIKSMIIEGFFKNADLTNALTPEFFTKDELDEFVDKTTFNKSSWENGIYISTDIANTLVSIVRDTASTYTSYLYPTEQETVECTEDAVEERSSIRPIGITISSEF